MNKTKIKHFHKFEKFNFVGFEFALRRTHGAWKIGNFPPKSKIVSLKQKVDDILKSYKSKPYIAFYLVNSVVRGWCLFYSFGNFKEIFSTLRYWLWHRVYRYLVRFYKFNPKYRIKSQRFLKKVLSRDIFKNHLLPTLYSKSKAIWWAIPPRYIPQITKKFVFYKDPYFLIDLGHLEVSTPSIKTGLSCYFLEDRLRLEQAAIKWKRGILRTLLLKSNGLCKNCGCSLIDNNESVEIHYIQSKALGGKAKFTNLALLCRECHKELTQAVKSKNLEQILAYEDKKILAANVSNLIIPTNNIE